MNNSKSQASGYEIPKELIDSILAQAGLEPLASDQVQPLDDNVSQR